MWSKEDKSLFIVGLGYILFLLALGFLLTSLTGCDSGWSISGYEI
tara:strand:- start:413 stop:547 length:135 start_codon:yes stop_codon:yes gene_type:complete